MQRHLITCEFPPQPGGVSDYTRAVAKELAATGDDVHVWCRSAEDRQSGLAGVTIHQGLAGVGHFPTPRWLFVQWVPHGYGYKSLNLMFCFWLWTRAAVNHDHIELMVHEPFLRFGKRLSKQAIAAFIHRIMIVFLLQAATRIWVSTEAWKPLLLPYCLRRKTLIRCLPVPSNIPIQLDAAAVNLVRSSYVNSGQILLGHFGTYGRAITPLLQAVMTRLFDALGDHALLPIGKGSHEFRASLFSMRSGRLHSAGQLDPPSLSLYLQACDVMIQPYADGISTRRGSAMAALAHGRPLVTTSGPLTEQFWSESAAVALEPADDPVAIAERVLALIPDNRERKRLGRAGQALYADRFQLSYTISAICTAHN